MFSIVFIVTVPLYIPTNSVGVFYALYFISCEMPGWMNHKLESRLPGDISTIADTHMIPL